MFRIIVILFLFVYVSYEEAIGQESHDGEISQSFNCQNLIKQKKVTEEYIDFYQHYISKLRGSQCAMYPSCSNYGLKVFSDRPFGEAMLYTADRMMRCGHDKRYYDVTVQYGDLSLLDWPSYEKTPKKLIYRGTPSFYTEVIGRKHDKTLSFISYLINHKLYEMALLEINRELYFYKSTNPLLFKNMLLCYEALEREEDGIYEYEMNFPDSIQSYFPVAIKAAKLYYNIDNYDMTLSSLNKSLNLKKEDLYQKYMFQTLIECKQMNYNSAVSIIDKIQKEFPEQTECCLKNRQIINSLSNIPLKRPVVAKALSIIPGMGYVYTKQYQTAITSLLINSVLAYATYSCIKRDNYGMAALSGIFSLTFYLGNILGAGKSANRYNKHIISTHMQKLTELNGFDNY